MSKATWDEDRILHISNTIFYISSHLRWLTRLLPHGAALMCYLGQILSLVASGALISQPPLFPNRPRGNEWPFPGWGWGGDWGRRRHTHESSGSSCTQVFKIPQRHAHHVCIFRVHRGMHTACIFRVHRDMHTACVFSESPEACIPHAYFQSQFAIICPFFWVWLISFSKKLIFLMAHLLSSFQIEVNNKHQPKRETSLNFTISFKC